MPDRYRILGQVSIEPTDEIALYAVPVAESTSVGVVEVSPKSSSLHVRTLITSIIVCNTDSASGNFSIRLFSADSLTFTYLLKGSSVAIDGTKVLSLGLVLGAGEQIKCSCASADYDFSVMGIEILSGGGPSG